MVTLVFRWTDFLRLHISTLTLERLMFVCDILDISLRSAELIGIVNGTRRDQSPGEMTMQDRPRIIAVVRSENLRPRRNESDSPARKTYPADVSRFLRWRFTLILRRNYAERESRDFIFLHFVVSAG